MRRKVIIEGFADRVKQVIDASPYSRAEIARRCDCERKSFHGLEEHTMNSATLAKFCAFMNVSADYLLGLSDSKAIKRGELVHLETLKQIMWERDIAILQLKELGYELGEKIDPADKRKPAGHEHTA